VPTSATRFGTAEFASGLWGAVCAPVSLVRQNAAASITERFLTLEPCMGLTVFPLVGNGTRTEQHNADYKERNPDAS